MTLGYYAPLPPARTGVAAYASVMLAALQRLGEVRANQPGDVNLYHVGNNILHGEIYRLALSEPGVVILHDAMLHHLLIGMLDQKTYCDEFVYNYGAWMQPAAEALWEGRGRVMSDPAYFRYPLLRRLAERSLAILVHGEEAERAVLTHCPGATVRRIPHLCLDDLSVPWPDAHQRSRFRRERLGVADSDFLLGVYGHLRESKRIPSVLEALNRLRGSGVPAFLLVAGDFASEDCARTLRSALKEHPMVRYLPMTSDVEFRTIMAAADVCVNLKYPSAGESSGIAVRAMALGLPVVLSDSTLPSGFPDGACIPVVTGPAETQSLVLALSWLYDNPGARHAMGVEARAYCATALDPVRVSESVWHFAAECREFGDRKAFSASRS